MLIRKENFIGINQNIPFKVLDSGLYRSLLTGIVQKSDIHADMLEITQGKNRAQKATDFAYQILTKPQDIIEYLRQSFTADTYAQLSEQERKAIITSLVCITYPIVYHFLHIMGLAFLAQPVVSRSYINQKLSEKYGSNRTLDIAIDAIIPMAIDLNLIKRSRIAMYEISAQSFISHPIISEIYIYTDITCSRTKSMLKEDLMRKVWYRYFSPSTELIKKSHLLEFTGQERLSGYIILKSSTASTNGTSFTSQSI